MPSPRAIPARAPTLAPPRASSVIEHAPKPNRRDINSRRRLLDAAEGVFAEHGFESATTREICRRAGVNIAAISYHFGDKQGLYLAVIEEIGRSIEARHPLRFERSDNPEDDLTRFVAAFIERILDDSVSAWRWRIIAREFVEPTAAIEVVVARMIRPNFEFLGELVAAALGPEAQREPALVPMCAASIIGQALMYRHCKSVVACLMGRPAGPEECARRAAHIARFSISALRGLRATLDSPPPRRPAPRGARRSKGGAR